MENSTDNVTIRVEDSTRFVVGQDIAIGDQPEIYRILEKPTKETMVICPKNQS